MTNMLIARKMNISSVELQCKGVISIIKLWLDNIVIGEVGAYYNSIQNMSYIVYFETVLGPGLRTSNNCHYQLVD